MACVPKILVIDDNRDMFSVMADALEAESCSIDYVLNTTEATELLRDAQYSLVICDIKMPGMDGITFYEKLKDQSQVPAFLFISGEVSDENIARLERLKVTTFLRKPFRLKELREHVRTVLR